MSTPSDDGSSFPIQPRPPIIPSNNSTGVTRHPSLPTFPVTLRSEGTASFDELERNANVLDLIGRDKEPNELIGTEEEGENFGTFTVPSNITEAKTLLSPEFTNNHILKNCLKVVKVSGAQNSKNKNKD